MSDLDLIAEMDTLCAAMESGDEPVDLQRRVGAWHRQRFPHATAADIVMKALAELGEVADAVLGRDLGGKGDVAEEAADVVIALMSLVDVHTSGHLLALVDVKLTELLAATPYDKDDPDGPT